MRSAKNALKVLINVKSELILISYKLISTINANNYCNPDCNPNLLTLITAAPPTERMQLSNIYC